MTKVDAKITDTREGGDLSLKGNDVELTGGWFNFVYLALFGGNVEQQTPQERNPEELAEDFWGNSLFHPESPALQFNSRTEKVLNETQLNSQGRAKIEDAVKSDLEFMSQFANIGVSVNIESFSRVGIEISIQEPGNLEDKEFRFIWDQTKRELEGISDEKEPEIEYQDYQVPGGSTGSGVSLSGYQTYTLTFEASSDQYKSKVIECSGTVQQIDSPVGYTLYKSVESDPYQSTISVGDSVEKKDTVIVKLDNQPSQDITVEIVVSYSDIQLSATNQAQTVTDPYRYIFFFDYHQQNVDVYDIDTSSVISTINLPTGYDFVDPCFRHIDSKVYLFGDNQYVTINAESSDANFLAVNSYSFDGNVYKACYGSDEDIFLTNCDFGDSNGWYTKFWDPNDGSIKTPDFNFEPFIPQNNDLRVSNVWYIRDLKLFCFTFQAYRSGGWIIFDSNFNIYRVFASENRKALFDYKRGILYHKGPFNYSFGGITTKDINGSYKNLFFVNSTSPGADSIMRDGIEIDFNNDLLLCTRIGKKYGFFGIYDVANFQYVDTGNCGGYFSGTEFEADKVWSPYDGKFYCKMKDKDSGVYSKEVGIFDLNDLSFPYGLPSNNTVFEGSFQVGGGLNNQNLKKNGNLTRIIAMNGLRE